MGEERDGGPDIPSSRRRNFLFGASCEELREWEREEEVGPAEEEVVLANGASLLSKLMLLSPHHPRRLFLAAQVSVTVPACSSLASAGLLR